MATWIPIRSPTRRDPQSFGSPVRHRDRARAVALIGLVMVVTYVAIALLVSFLPLRDPLQLSAQRLAAPSPEFPLGTDALGRDLLSRILFGARLSMQVAVLSVAIATIVGGILGLISGYLGGVADLVIGRVIRVLRVPAILLALGSSRARTDHERDHRDSRRVHADLRARRARSGARAQARDFVEAARAIVATQTRIVVRHIVPNLFHADRASEPGALVVRVTHGRSLSFLGLVAQPPAPSWG